MNATNSTTSNMTPPSDLSNHQLFIGFGLGGLTTNAIVLITLATNYKFFANSAFMVVLAIGDAINGLGFVVGGALRIDYVVRKMVNAPMRKLDCLIRFTTFQLIGIQLTVLMILLMGAERLLAVAFFSWYYKKWSNKKSWALTGLVITYCTCSIGAVWITAGILPNTTTTSNSCTPPLVVGAAYTMYNYGLAVACGTISVIVTLAALVMFRIKRKNTFNRQQTNNNSERFRKFIKKQWQITTTMTCVAMLDFAAVVVPNAFIIMIPYVKFPPIISKDIGFRAELLFCFRSCLNLFIYLVFNTEFRQNFLRLLSFRKIQIHPTLSSKLQNASAIRVHPTVPPRKGQQESAM